MQIQLDKKYLYSNTYSFCKKKIYIQHFMEAFTLSYEKFLQDEEDGEKHPFHIHAYS